MTLLAGMNWQKAPKASGTNQLLSNISGTVESEPPPTQKITLAGKWEIESELM